jgi:hypothetical protein
MYDIEVINGKSYAVIEEDSAAYEFLKAMNSALMLKKLGSETGAKIYLTVSEVIPLCKGFQIKDLRRLHDIGLLQYDFERYFDETSTIFKRREGYTFTDYGLEIVNHIREQGGDVEIRL